jgi:MYXO-CTERM domain-containing protein
VARNNTYAMHTRRLAAIIMGAWLAGMVLMLVVPERNLASVDELLRTPSPKAQGILEKVEEVNARPLLIHHASELNRWLVRNWERVQLGLGVALSLCLFFGVEGKRFTLVLCLLMLATVVFLHWFLTPEMEKLAEVVDFVAPSEASVARDRFRSLQAGYFTAEGIQLVLGLLLAGGLLSRRRRRHSVEIE